MVQKIKSWIEFRRNKDHLFLRKIRGCIEYQENKSSILITKKILGGKKQYLLDKKTKNIVTKLNKKKGQIFLIKNTTYFGMYLKVSNQKDLYDSEGTLMVSNYKKIDYLNRFSENKELIKFLIIEDTEKKYQILTEDKKIIPIYSYCLLNQHLILFNQERNEIKIYNRNFVEIELIKYHGAKLCVKKIDVTEIIDLMDYFVVEIMEGTKTIQKLYWIHKNRVEQLLFFEWTQFLKYDMDQIIKDYVMISCYFKKRKVGKILYYINHTHFIPNKEVFDQYQDYNFVEVYHKRYILAIKKDRIDVLDKHGNRIFGGEYSKIRMIDGYWHLQKGELNGIATLKGNILIPLTKQKIKEDSDSFIYMDENNNQVVVKK